MQKQQFSITITASRDRVWNVLWQDQTFRDWASIIDEGSYMVGELKTGSQIQFISSSSGYGVTSLVEKYIPNELLILRHQADTQDNGKNERDQEWTGGSEKYTATDHDGITILTVEIDTPPELVEIFNDRMPKALARVKVLAEI